MKNGEKGAMDVIAAAAVLGVTGDVLLRATPWGVNVTILMTVLIVCIGLLIRWRCIPVAKATRWLFLPAIFFAFAFAWRDSETVKALNGLAICILLALIVLRSRKGALWFGGILEYSVGLLDVWLSAPLLAARLAQDEYQSVTADNAGAKIVAVGRGILIATPLLLLFGMLFISADAAFEHFVVAALDWDFPTIVSHLFWFLIIAAVAGGILYRIVRGSDLPSPVINEKSSSFSLGKIEMGVILGILNALFLAFIAVQFGYFFGGTNALSESMTIATYARRGFFELVTVTLLMLPLLLLFHWLQRQESLRQAGIFHWLAGTLIGMLFVIMGSALHRMYLYQEIFGLTELRLYTTIFMGWLALVLLWFIATVLRGRRPRFAFGALTAGILIIGLLDVTNPDAFIVRVNTMRAIKGGCVDVGYLTTLSADAFPMLIETLPLIAVSDQKKAANALLYSQYSEDASDWRSWNLGVQMAQDVIKAEQSRLMAMAAQ